MDKCSESDPGLCQGYHSTVIEKSEFGSNDLLRATLKRYMIREVSLNLYHDDKLVNGRSPGSE